MADKTSRPPIVLRGVAASQGIGIGKVFVLNEESLSYDYRSVPKDEIKKEIQRFRTAVLKTRSEFIQTREKVLNVLGKSHASLIDAHLLILEDPLFTKDIEKKITQEQVNAEASLVAVLDQIGRSFDKLNDDFFRQRKDDIMDVGKRVMRYLLGRQGGPLTKLKERCVIIAHNLGPSDTLSLRDDFEWKDFATDIGGRTSHTAILAQGLEIPAVVGLKDVTSHIRHGDHVIIDGNEGLVIINPTMATLENYRKVREIELAELRDLEKYKDLPAKTLDGRQVALAANIESHEEIRTALSHGAEGIGLYRTEFLYLNRKDLPSEEEQYAIYEGVARQMLPYAVIIRTMDMGGDKPRRWALGG